MSEKDKPSMPPPDDFSKTTPNINVGGGGGSDEPRYDWDKTNYNLPKQPTGDDWGKTITNLRPIDTDSSDFGKTIAPGAQRNAPSTPEWGMTDANIRVNPADIGSKPEDFGGGPRYEKTTPYFQLPEADRLKYQNIPPTPAEKAEQERKDKQAKQGIPMWVWAATAMGTMFVFALLVLAAVYFLWVMRPTNFEVTVVNAPVGSRILVDDKQWGYASDDGTRKLTNLEPGKRTISIVHPSYECRSEEIKAEAGEKTEPIRARCTEIKADPETCGSFQQGDFDKAERCYNMALDALALPPDPEQLVRALSILIINFDIGKHDIPIERHRALQKGAGFIKQLPPNIVLEVGGHTDNQGPDSVNQPLSERRAEEVKKKLISYGVREEALQTRGYGSSRPRPDADNNTEQGRFLNRRIEYKIVRN